MLKVGERVICTETNIENIVQGAHTGKEGVILHISTSSYPYWIQFDDETGCYCRAKAIPKREEAVIVNCMECGATIELKDQTDKDLYVNSGMCADCRMKAIGEADIPPPPSVETVLKDTAELLLRTVKVLANLSNRIKELEAK
jgi:hypothetical protein